LDLSQITLCNTSFVGSTLKEVRADLLYEVKRLNGQDQLVFLLLEHKSNVEEFVTCQLLKYMIGIWEYRRKQDMKLFAVLPVVVYNGQRAWNVGQYLRGILNELPEEMKPYFPDFKYHLVDVSRHREEQIEREMTQLSNELRLIIFSMGHFNEDMKMDLVMKTAAMIARLIQEKQSTDYIRPIMRYMMGCGAKVQYEQVYEEVNKRSPLGGEVMQTMRQELIEIGMKIGEQRGVKIGEQRGVKIGEQRGIEIGEQRGIKIGEQRGRETGLKEGLEEGLEKGLEKGREDGLRKGLRKAIMLALELRFRITSGPCVRQIAMVMDVDKLETILNVAKTVPDMKQFEDDLNKILES
jgi:hypothetical protein